MRSSNATFFAPNAALRANIASSLALIVVSR
jgi:hypothetical protein